MLLLIELMVKFDIHIVKAGQLCFVTVVLTLAYQYRFVNKNADITINGKLITLNSKLIT